MFFYECKYVQNQNYSSAANSFLYYDVIVVRITLFRLYKMQLNVGHM